MYLGFEEKKVLIVSHPWCVTWGGPWGVSGCGVLLESVGRWPGGLYALGPWQGSCVFPSCREAC